MSTLSLVMTDAGIVVAADDHRDGGLPAIEWFDGSVEYWVNGKQIAEAEAKKLAIKPDSCDGKIVEINGKKYQLKEIVKWPIGLILQLQLLLTGKWMKLFVLLITGAW